MANILGSGTSIMNMANSLLDNGRAIFSRNGGTGMSARSRALLEGFYNNGSALFNQLYTKAENQEVMNVTKIMALRAGLTDRQKSDQVMVDASTTSGTNVDTTA